MSVEFRPHGQEWVLVRWRRGDEECIPIDLVGEPKAAPKLLTANQTRHHYRDHGLGRPILNSSQSVCDRCKHYVGIEIRGSEPFICAMHPRGVEDSCPDSESI